MHEGRFPTNHLGNNLYGSFEDSKKKKKRLLTFNAFGLRIQRPGFASQSLPGSVNPDVHGLDFTPLRELHVLLLDGFTQRGAVGRCHLVSHYRTPEDKSMRPQGMRPRGPRSSRCVTEGGGLLGRGGEEPPYS